MAMLTISLNMGVAKMAKSAFNYPLLNPKKFKCEGLGEVAVQ